ncbi:MAG: hypothetical protein HGJ94_04165 [Desulfosarcina sp.]|nr:hypothetical protein [Desulfosarcina sp.]
MDQADILIKAGHTHEATAYFEKAIYAADTLELKTQTTVTWANALSRASRVRNDDPELQVKAAELYHSALPRVTGDLKRLTFNNYGSLLLRQDNPMEALAVLRAVEEDYARESEPVERSRYLYNLARAFEKNDELAAAKDRYQKSAVADPKFTPASRAVSRVLLKLIARPDLVKETAQWLDTVVDHGDLSLTQETIRSVLTRSDWVSQPGFEKVLISLMRYLTVTRVGPQEFKKQWQKNLTVTGEAHQDTRLVAREMVAAYYEDFPIAFEPERGHSRFVASLRAAGQPDAERVVSAFMKIIGDGYLAIEQEDQALQRYALAWTLDTTNMEAALYAADVLLKRREKIDQSNDLLNQFIFFLFEGKGRAYLGKDWENILRFHMVLGTIYVQRGEWGFSGNPQSAIFQLEHAIEAHKRLFSQVQEDAGPIAGVKAELAYSYEEAGHYRSAGATYVDAAETAMVEGDHELTRTVVEKISRATGRLDLSEQDDRRVEHIRKLLKAPQ